MTQPTSLVTGGAGFIGSHVADELLRMGHHVVVLDDLSGGCRENVPGAAELVVGSIVDEATIANVFSRNTIDHVFHLAAYAAEGLSHFIRRFNYTNNLIGTANLVNAAVNGSVRSFVFTSSIAVYGSGQLPMREEDLPRPEDPYGIGKLAVELDLEAAHRLFGLNFVVFRPHNVYGERQNLGDKYRNVIGIFMNQTMRGEPMTIFGDGKQTRAFTHVGDVAPVIACSVDLPELQNQVFNIGADTAVTVNHLAAEVAGAMGAPCRTVHLPARQETVHAYSSHGRLSALIGYRPTISLDEGLQRMAAWAKSAGPRPSPRFGIIEIERNLPESWR